MVGGEDDIGTQPGWRDDGPSDANGNQDFVSAFMNENPIDPTDHLPEFTYGNVEDNGPYLDFQGESPEIPDFPEMAFGTEFDDFHVDA
jgi:hypothetical protein